MRTSSINTVVNLEILIINLEGTKSLTNPRNLVDRYFIIIVVILVIIVVDIMQCISQ